MGGFDGVLDADRTRDEDGVPVLAPADAAEVAEVLRHATAHGLAVRVRGGGTKPEWGPAPTRVDAILSTERLARVIDHAPGDMTCVAEAGLRLADLQAAIADVTTHRQRLMLDPPGRAEATLGGVLATAAAGPRRVRYGTPRDLVIGARYVTGDGLAAKTGGRVVKNVAGYDVARLLVGSLGILGVLIEVSLKVVPRPATETTLSLECNQTTALQCFGDWNLKPWPISASAWTEGRLFLRLSGAVAAVQTACREIGGDVLDDAEAGNFWKSVREQTAAWFKLEPGETLWRLSLPASAPALELRVERPDPMFLEWHGMQRWLKAQEIDRTDLRAQVHQLGGHLTRFRHGPPRAAHPPDARQGPAFEPLAPALSAIHRRLKAEFDPHGIFNFNRLQPNL